MKRNFIKILVTGVIVIIAFVLQSYISLSTNLLVSTPNLLLLVTSILGFMRGENFGSLTGLFCGFLVDIAFGDVLGLYALIYTYIGFFSGIFKRLLHNDHVYMAMLLVFFNDFVYNSFVYIFRFLLRNKLTYSFYFDRIILPEMIFTAFLMLLLYKAFYLLNEKVYAEKQESELYFGK